MSCKRKKQLRDNCMWGTQPSKEGEHKTRIFTDVWSSASQCGVVRMRAKECQVWSWKNRETKKRKKTERDEECGRESTVCQSYKRAAPTRCKITRWNLISGKQSKKKKKKKKEEKRCEAAPRGASSSAPTEREGERESAANEGLAWYSQCIYDVFPLNLIFA